MQKIFENCCLRFRICTRLQVILLLLPCASSLVAQAGTGIAGGHTTSEDLHFSYSVGQVFNDAISHSEYFVSHGIQHPMLLVIFETTLDLEKSLRMNVYPNPVADQLHIEWQSPGMDGCRVLLVNMQGKVLIDRVFETTDLTIPLETIGAGHYVLKVITGKLESNTFQIIKAK